MPIYDVCCAECGYEGTALLTISALSTWDRDSQCPQCRGGPSSFQRMIKTAPASIGGGTPDQTKAAELASSKAKFARSGQKDDMQHREFQRRNPDRIAAAVESVRKGEFEGF